MSQDHFLSKVYESVVNKTTTPSNKPQNLKQAYYRVILEQLNEDTEILMQQRGSDNVEEFSVSDDVANKIRSQIGVSGTDFKNSLDAIFKKAGIEEKTTSGAYNNALRSIKWFLSESNFNNPKELFQSAVKNKGFIDLLSKTNKFNLLSDTINAAKLKIKDDFKIEVNEDSLKSFFISIIKDKPDIGGRLGDAEFFCSLFTNAQLATGQGEKKVGDLQVGSSKIELKATGTGLGGRLSGDGTANRAMVKIPELLKDKLKYSSAKKETIIQNLKEFELIVNKESQTPNKKEAYEKIKQWFETKEKSSSKRFLTGFKNAFDPENKINSLDTLVNYNFKTPKRGGISFVNVLKEKIKEQIDKTQKETEIGPKLKGGVERQLDNLLYSAINSIRDDETINMNDIIEIIYLTNNYADSTLKEDLKQFLPQTPQSFFEQYSNNLKAINNLIGAMHLYSYTHMSGFNKLMVINVNSFNSLIFEAPHNLKEALTIVQTPGIEIDCSVDVPSTVKAAIGGKGKGGTEIGKSVFFSYKA